MDPSLLLSMIERLPDTSLTAALMAGGRQYFGWGVDRAIAADLYDAVNLNTTATGNWKEGKTPTIPSWPRPKIQVAPNARKSDGPRKRFSLKEIHANLVKQAAGQGK
jgi:hypothetical protein